MSQRVDEKRDPITSYLLNINWSGVNEATCRVRGRKIVRDSSAFWFGLETTSEVGR